MAKGNRCPSCGELTFLTGSPRFTLRGEMVDFKDEIRVTAIVGKPSPSPEEVEASHRKWGDSG